MAEEVRLIGLSDGLGEVNISEIAYQEILNAIKRLPEGNAIELVRQLPAGILSKVCTEGVKENLSIYIAPAIAGVVVGGVTGYMSESVVKGILIGAAGAVIIYLITKPSNST